MSDFDELIGADVEDKERERLHAVHKLLVEAGSPPELSAALRNVRQPGEVRVLRKHVPRKVALLAAAIVVLGGTFGIGFATGNWSAATAPAKTPPVESLVLSGTKAAPHAHATLDVLAAVSGNWPLILRASGLPKLAAPDYYYVWLVRHGKPLLPCGYFVVSKPSSPLKPMKLWLSAPYKLKKGDTWIISRRAPNQHGAGQIVMRPTAA